MKARPRIAIYGAGMIGNYMGGRLHDHAHVRFFARAHVATSLKEHGLRVSDLLGHDKRILPNALDIQMQPDAVRDVDLVLVTVKSAATIDVAHELSDALASGVPVISFQNGIRNAAELRASLPGHNVLSGVVPFNVTQPEPGHFHQGSSGELKVERSPVLEPFLPAFAAAGIALEQHGDMQGVLWAKLLLNLNNPLNALSGLPLREELSRRAWRRCLALLQSEGLRVLAAAGIRPAQLTTVPARWVPNVLSLPDLLFNRLASHMLAIDPLARSSMWQDLQAGRRTEIDYINGEIVALAASKGLRAPLNTRIIALIREAEKSYEPWSGRALLEELRELR